MSSKTRAPPLDVGDENVEEQVDQLLKEDALKQQQRKVSAFLSDSRILTVKSARLCKNSGCAFLCTGVAPRYCCKKCGVSPGSHGPRCERRMLPCSSAGCEFAYTGLGDAEEPFCCRMCARGQGHGPQCWQQLAVEPEAEPTPSGKAVAGDAEEREQAAALERVLEENAQVIEENEEMIRRLHAELNPHPHMGEAPRGAAPSRRGRW